MAIILGLRRNRTWKREFIANALHIFVICSFWRESFDLFAVIDVKVIGQ